MSGDFNLTITKINGVEFNGGTFTTTVNAYDPAQLLGRKVLLEEFTTEGAIYGPSGNDRIKNIINQPKFKGKVNWVTHHAYKSLSGNPLIETDKYTILESQSYLRFFGTGLDYVPALMIDRTIFKGNIPVMTVLNDLTVTEINDFLIDALITPTTITIDITQENTVATDRKVKITAHGIDKSGTPPTEDMYVVIFLLENSISSTTQYGMGGGVYIHNNVIRDVLGDNAAGTKIEWDGNSYSVTAEATLPTGWNAENMDVVAFVAKNYMNPMNNAQVLNSEITPLAMTSATSIENITGNDMRVYAENGAIVADGEYTSISIFSIDGKEFRNNNLPKGAYIVKVENNGQNIVKKVMVK